MRTLNIAFVHGETPAFAVASASATFCTCRISAVCTLLRRVWLVSVSLLWCLDSILDMNHPLKPSQFVFGHAVVRTDFKLSKYSATYIAPAAAMSAVSTGLYVGPGSRGRTAQSYNPTTHPSHEQLCFKNAKSKSHGYIRHLAGKCMTANHSNNSRDRMMTGYLRDAQLG